MSIADNIQLPENIRRGDASDWRQLAEITADAFRDDPVNNWLFGNPLAILSAFCVLTRDIYSKRGICHLAGDAGATMWLDNLSGDVDDDFSKFSK